MNPYAYISADGPNDLRTVIDRLQEDMACSSDYYNIMFAATLKTLLKKSAEWERNQVKSALKRQQHK